MRRGALLLGVLAVLALGAGGPVAGAATPTGNLLVLLDQTPAGTAAAASAVQNALAQLGARPAGRSVPEIGLLTVRPPTGVAAAAFGRVLAAVPGVASVSPELRYLPRTLPDDP